MTDTRTLGPWLRRFLAEHLVSERNLARNTQRSYRDTLVLLLPSSAARGANRSTGWPSSISPPSVCCSSSHILKMRGAAPRRPAISPKISGKGAGGWTRILLSALLGSK